MTNSKISFSINNSILLVVLSTIVIIGLNTTIIFGQQQVTLTAIVSEPKGRWDTLFDNAMQKLKERHSDMNIQIDYRVLPYDDTRTQIMTSMIGKTPIDIISVDQIWLGEFAEAGFLSDLTDRAKIWNRSSEWYKINWEGGIYDNKVRGIWAWTDIRAMWYWKDLLDQANIDADSLKTWDGYISAAKNLSNSLSSLGIIPVHLVGASHSPDMWYPYLWMLGGEILEKRDGHPTKDSYWYPVFNSNEGIKALEFIKEQVQAGIKPQINHFWGQEFADKKFAIMLEGSWLLGNFPREEWPSLDQRIGILPMFPVPDEKNNTATMMGGWLLSIPETSQNKDLAWELITIMIEEEVLVPMLVEFGYLPTQKTIGEGTYSKQLNETIPYYKEMISMIQYGHSRPSVPEYPQIVNNIKQAIEEVYYNMKEPKQALDDAALKSAKILGWK